MSGGSTAIYTYNYLAVRPDIKTVKKWI